ncbi:hypothetical protein BS50DRAFT_295619 [Corynespora cassiicola Philippines]|uniref:Cellular morphogenesis protein n=1 Tax=Corynespora cassiicola Philippines TaxID=1448308 RepID=A0A2T2NWK8_CORCC|nr:hypothetical protein BS50DRAFT_295619 [Corynespora cassiicola Philippines]
MRDLFSSSLGWRAGTLALSLLLSSPHLIQPATAFDFTPVSLPNLALERLGRVGFAGNFDSISLYQYEGQSENQTTTQGALLSRFPNGVFAPINRTDADVRAICVFDRNGNRRIIFGGNFTSVGQLHTPGGIAQLDPATGNVTALEGLNGSVNALFCDSENGRVFVGGSFTGVNSSNAIVWTDDWESMPFQGFNGPVHSIIQAPNGNFVFGGEFSGLGDNTTIASENNTNTQAIPIGSASISAQTSSGRPGLTDPKNIVCKNDSETSGDGSTWLLSDNGPGFWRADFGFGFEPTRLRLYNTNLEGRGTKTFRFTALPDGGIMNLSYVDPADGNTKYCDARCSLPEGNTTAQEFTFVNRVGMNSFRIDISDWYGSGAGLNGIELYQDDIYAYAISDFNEPQCGGAATGASATATGPWQTSPSHDSNSQYLSATLQGNSIATDAVSVVFEPSLRQSGNYSIRLYTPGCLGDDTCSTRGQVNLTLNVRPSGDQPPSVLLFQTNNFDKYDELYEGPVEITDGFRPSVTLTPASGQTGPKTFAAQRVRFEQKSATSGQLNGLFEYNPENQEVDTDLSDSMINEAGANLSPREAAIITTLARQGDRFYVGGNFSSSDGYNNIFAIDNGNANATALTGRGLNSQVMTIFANDSTLYVGGNFTNTNDNSTPDLNGIAVYNNNQWQAVGAGVQGIVTHIVPFTLNITENSPEEVLGISGYFDSVNSFEANAAFAANGFAIWVPSQRNWLHNLETNTISVQGRLMAFVDVPDEGRLFAGAVSSQTLSASGAAALNHDSGLLLLPFPTKIQESPRQGSSRKRAIIAHDRPNATGVITATFYQDNNMNKTILGGRFSATGSEGQNISNVLIVDGNDSDKVTGFGDGIDTNSTVTALGVLGTTLYAGGVVSGRIGENRIAGIVAYDLAGNTFAGTQPPALAALGGTGLQVSAIIPRPKSEDVFVAGNFESAGDLSCAALCIWNTQRNQWINPGGDLSGQVSALKWISDNRLLISGNLTAGNNQTSILLYDAENSEYQGIAGSSELPGPVTAMNSASDDGSQIWAAGNSTEGSAFLHRFNGNEWLPVNADLFGEGTAIRGIQILSLQDTHAESDLVPQNQDLLILGSINVPNFGTASGVLFDGTSLIPFLLSNTAQNGHGSLSEVFVENPDAFFDSGGNNLALGFIVLIALAIALALTFLLVVAGIIVEWYRKKAKGYSPAPTNYTDRMGNVGRVPPEQLFGTLSGNRAPAI